MQRSPGFVKEEQEVLVSTPPCQPLQWTLVLNAFNCFLKLTFARAEEQDISPRYDVNRDVSGFDSREIKRVL